jgi:hypothetical protein
MNAIHSLRTPTISKLVLVLHLSFGSIVQPVVRGSIQTAKFF